MTDAAVDSSLQELHQKYHASRMRQKKFKRISRILTLVFVGVILGYLFMLFGRFKTQYHPDNFEEPLARRAQELLPILRPEIERLVNEVTPVYADMARQKMQDALPELQAVSFREKEIFLTSIREQGEDQLNASLERIADKQQAKIEKYFPNLATSEGVDKIGKRWKARIEKDSGAILVHFNDLYTKDIAALETTLEGFRPNEFESMSEEELSRYFLHLWLVRLDRLVWLGDAGEGLFPNETEVKITDEN